MPNPNFLVVGASRSGTTSLHHYLRQHPKIHLPPEKEVHFFDFKYGKGLDWYRQKFMQGKVNGEASPFYLPLPVVATRVKRDFPNVKIIALCREPGARAYSHYWFNRVRNEDDKPFLQAIKAEESRLKGKSESTAEWRRFSYLARGKYAEQLTRWLWNPSNAVAIKSEDLYENPQAIVAQICDWLGLEPHEFNVKVHRKQMYPPMKPATRLWLDKYFESHNQKLESEWGISWNRF